ncbi:MAG: hypothetical protein K6F49_06070 [Saccharofermentans sp.]|nr:hypothetical protein [Saccharofermentans sp.]
MEYYFEIYFDVNCLDLLGIEEQCVNWSGIEYSQDPPVYKTSSGLMFEKIMHNNFKLVTGEDLPGNYIGLVLRGNSLHELSTQINLNTCVNNPVLRFIGNLNERLGYILLLCRVEERISERYSLEDNNDVINLVVKSLDWNTPKDIVIHKKLRFRFPYNFTEK